MLFLKNPVGNVGYWNAQHCVRGTLKIPRTFSRFLPFYVLNTLIPPDTEGVITKN